MQYHGFTVTEPSAGEFQVSGGKRDMFSVKFKPWYDRWEYEVKSDLTGEVVARASTLEDALHCIQLEISVLNNLELANECSV